jgi:photosystem II stability/assembly factor-like uncharacterized protein
MTFIRTILFILVAGITISLPLSINAQVRVEILREANNYLQSTDSTQYYYTAIASSNANNCTVVGRTEHWKRFVNEPLILRTTNGGESWEEQKSGLPSGKTVNIATPRSVCAVDSLHSFICGDSGMFLRTSDAGLTWQNLPISTRSNLLNIYFASKDNGIVCGRYGTVCVTSNGGQSWEVYENLSPTSFIAAAGFLNNLHSHWLVYDSYRGKQFIGRALLDSQTATWDSSLVYNDPYNGQSGKFTTSIFFIDSSNGFLVGGDKGPDDQAAFEFRAFISHTVDGGMTWNQVYDKNMSNRSELTAICLLTPKLGVATGRFNSFLLTSDGGSSWIQDTINQPFNLQLVQGLAPADHKTFYGVCQSNGPIFKGHFEDANSILPEHILDQNKIVLFPQPANNILNLNFQNWGNKPAFITINTVTGKKAECKVLSLSSKSCIIDISTLTNGFYVLNINDGSGDLFKKSFLVLRK